MTSWASITHAIGTDPRDRGYVFRATISTEHEPHAQPYRSSHDSMSFDEHLGVELSTENLILPLFHRSSCLS